jgi:hypothetical protein
MYEGVFGAWSNSIARDDEKDVFGWMDGKKARKKWSKEQRSEGGGGKAEAGGGGDGGEE